MPLTKLYKCCFCLRIHDNNYIDNIINLSVSLPLKESDCEKRGTGGKDWVIYSCIRTSPLQTFAPPPLTTIPPSDNLLDIFDPLIFPPSCELPLYGNINPGIVVTLK